MKWPWQRQSKPDAQEIVTAAAQQAATAAAQEVARALLAQVPDTGNQSSPLPLYAYNHPSRWYVPQDPANRSRDLGVTIETLRKLADTYDVLRACIQHLKREVAAVPLQIVAKDDGDTSDATKRRIAEVEEFFSTAGGLGGFTKRRAHFEREICEDLLVIGACAIYQQPTRGGGIAQVYAIDAATIRPKVDAYGWAPDGPVYEQWIDGLCVAQFTRDELVYDGIDSVSYQPYFKSPVEWLIYTITSALRADEWNRVWLTDGNTPADMLALPEEWTPDQVRAYAEWWDSLMSGTTAARQKTKFVPGGSQRVGSPSRKDQDFSQFELWLLRRTCAIIGVQPASIGFVGEQYKVTQGESMAATTEFGAGALLDFRVNYYNDLLQRMGYDELEAVNVMASEDDANERARRNQVLVTTGIKTINEARADEGLDPIEGGDQLLISGVPLTQLLQPNDPESSSDETTADVASEPEDPSAGEAESEMAERALRQWERKALNRVKSGKSPSCSFETEALAPELATEIGERLARCGSATDVKSLFGEVMQRVAGA